MATAEAAAKTESKKGPKTADDVRKRFATVEGQEITRPEVDGWFNAEKALANEQFVKGKIVSYMAFKGDNGPRQAVIIELMAGKQEPKFVEIEAQNKGDKTVTLKPGQHIAVGISFGLDSLLDYVENKGFVLIAPIKKKSIGGGKSTWEYLVKVSGEKGPRPNAVAVAASNAGTASDMDDIPF